MKCAVITPVGPGHEEDYEVCKGTIERAWSHGQGLFTGLEIVPMWDLEGAYGRSARRNDGIAEAQRLDCDWIFFLDADDLMNQSAFEEVAPYLAEYDAVWGNICETAYGGSDVKLRDHQLIRIEKIDDVLLHDPALTLQMGHFVRTECAAATGFDAEMDTGEDFKYYLGLWERYRCIKAPHVFFINRRGHHSTGPRSADGRQWREAVQGVISGHCRGRNFAVQVTHDGSEAEFHISNPFDIIQNCHKRGAYFELKELEYLRKSLGKGRRILEVGANVGNHVVFYAKLMEAKKIYPFEPNPDSVRLLKANISANGLRPVVDSRGIGIGAGARFGKFSVSQADNNNLGAARLKSGGEIKVYPLDAKMQGEKIDFMKVDVEGMEFDVLDGARKLIEANRPVLMIEVFRDRLADFEAWCETNEYRVVHRFDYVNAVNYLAVAA